MVPRPGVLTSGQAHVLRHGACIPHSKGPRRPESQLGVRCGWIGQFAMLYELESPGLSALIGAGEVDLEARLLLPPAARGVVIFAEAVGSGLNNAADASLAGDLRDAGFGAMLMDLYTPSELDEDERGGHLRFATRMLSQRLVHAIDWLAVHPTTRELAVGLVGASTAAAAALLAATARPEAIGAVVCRGGRPDLARASLSQVSAPTLLIVGGQDYMVADFNREALEQMRCDRHLLLVPHAGHRFEEPGALSFVSSATLDWFARHLRGREMAA